MIIRRILGSLLWLVALVVLVGQFKNFGADWKYVEYATIVITLCAGYLMITK
jgi:hypothetical protein